jgi:hypothetical protein
MTHLPNIDVMVTLPYLRRLLAYVEAANEDEASEWRGSWTNVLPDLRRLAGRSVEDTALLWGGVPTVADVIARMEDRGLDPELLRRVREDVPLPRAPRAPPTADRVRADFDAAVAGFAAVLPGRASLNVHHEYEATPEKTKSLRAWTRAFETVLSRYPAVWAIVERKLRILRLEVRPTDSADASWGLYLTVNLKGSSRPYVGTLIHEIGHMFEDDQPDGFEIGSGRGLYGNAPFSHNYFQDRPVEDFAECFRQFFVEPGVLRRAAPEKYEDMRARLSNRSASISSPAASGVNSSKEASDYRMRHRPSQDGPPAHDLVTQDIESPMPENMLAHPERYTGSRNRVRGFWPSILKAQGNPNAPITIYRALPSTAPAVFENGDWVTLSPGYARRHIESNVPGGQIISAIVPAHTVVFAGDDLMEWGYWGPAVDATAARIASAWLARQASKPRRGQ